MNLHNVVRNAITSIHADESCVLYQSLGQKNIKGVVKPIYAEPIDILANFQPLDSMTLKHMQTANLTNITVKAYLYSNEPTPVAGQQRLSSRNGDFIKRGDSYWLVTSVLEDWNADGWCCVGLYEQITPPDFSASEWSESYVGSGQ